ncbi:MAG: type I methionyl aminopeptidase [Armatimonadetes bacterium]|nr:MAG: type I methionyl aminopeptidase [Armatimonadota bacterium]
MNGTRLITKKTQADFDKMIVAGRCVAAIHTATRAAIEPGTTTRELDMIAREVLKEWGCQSSFLGYGGPSNPFPGVICTSPNSVIVHGIPGDYVLAEGDIISIDAGAIFEGWHGDAAFTMAVGDVPDDVVSLLETTERALWAGIEQAVHGNRLGDIGAAVEAVAEAGGLGVVRDYVGHGIGRQMHEAPSVPNYGRPGRGLRLKTGMALAIEPMFNLGTESSNVLDDEWTVVTADGQWSAHFEHTVLLTEAGSIVSTLPEPKLVTP